MMIIRIDNEQENTISEFGMHYVFRSKPFRPSVSFDDIVLRVGSINILCEKSTNLIETYSNEDSTGLTNKYIYSIDHALKDGFKYFLIDSSGLDYNGLESLIHYLKSNSINGILFMNWTDLGKLFSLDQSLIVAESEIKIIDSNQNKFKVRK